LERDVALILSDFDGVMTDPAHEAARVEQLFLEWIAGQDHRFIEVYGEHRARVLAAPTHHGWYVNGRLSGYADEDGFIMVQALAERLDRLADAGDSYLDDLRQRAAERAGMDSRFTQIASAAYQTMAAEVMAAPASACPIEPAVVRALGELCQRGHRVVVVSNSATDRVLDLLTKAGIAAHDHRHAPTATIRVRGQARKYGLGDTPQLIEIGDRWVDIDRPGYRAILTEEQPHVIIGDVVSFDLALPMALSTESPEPLPLLLLRTRSYTPAWSMRAFSESTTGRRQGAARSLLQTFDDLPHQVDARGSTDR
jgi:FMN phosphatase YigB (HAD superfamily)